MPEASFLNNKKECGMEKLNDKKIKFHEQKLEYKRGFKWYGLPYSEISHAYLRIEEIKGRLCCGVANFDMNFLMLKTKTGEIHKIEVSSKELVKEMLRELQIRNSEIEVGYKKQEQNLT